MKSLCFCGFFCLFCFCFLIKIFKKLKKKDKVDSRKKKLQFVLQVLKFCCVQLPCVTTCRLRARSPPYSPFLNVHFACLKFKISSVSQLTRNFWICDITEVKWAYILKNKTTQKVPIWIGLILEATLNLYLSKAPLPNFPFLSETSVQRS